MHFSIYSGEWHYFAIYGGYLLLRLYDSFVQHYIGQIKYLILRYLMDKCKCYKNQVEWLQELIKTTSDTAMKILNK